MYVGWFDVIGLRPDGEFVCWSTAGEYPGTRPVEDRHLWLTSLVDAARRYWMVRERLKRRIAMRWGPLD